MIVAIYIKTESGDEYLNLFVDESLEEIKQSLYDNMESYQPVGNYMVSTKKMTTKEKQELNKMLEEWSDASWNNDEE